MNFLRSVWITARQEWADAIRSKRALVFMVLFIAASTGMVQGFIFGLQEVEKVLLSTLQLPSSREVGVATLSLWDSPMFKERMEDWTDDQELAASLMGSPPISLIYCLLAFYFAPWLVILVGTNRVSDELATGSARFVLTRISPLAWSLGKFIGIALLIIPALLLAAVAAWISAYFRLSIFQPGDAVFHLLIMSGKVWLVCLYYLGLSIGVSQLTRSSTLATVYGIVAALFLSLLNGLPHIPYFKNSDTWMQFWDAIGMLIPHGYRNDLWWNDAGHLVPAAFMLIILGLLWLMLGCTWMSRSDK